MNLLQQYFDLPNSEIIVWVLHGFVALCFKTLTCVYFRGFFQWQRPTCPSMRIRIGCHMSRFVLYMLFFFGIFVCVLHQMHDIRLSYILYLLYFLSSPPLRDALSVLSPAPTRLWMWSMRASRTAMLLLPVSLYLTILLLKHRLYTGYMDIAIQDRYYFVM